MPPRMRTKELPNRVEQHFYETSRLFYDSWRSLVLQRLESAIMTRVMRELRYGGVLCLPIHDDLIVQKRHASLARDVMLRCYTETMTHWLGCRFEIEVETK